MELYTTPFLKRLGFGKRIGDIVTQDKQQTRHTKMIVKETLIACVKD